MISVMAISVSLVYGQGNPMVEEVEGLILKGEYAAAVEKTSQNFGDRQNRLRLGKLEMRALLEMGRNDDALMRARGLYRRASGDPQLCWEIVRALNAMGERDAAREVTKQTLEQNPPADASSRVAYGRLMLLDGWEPKEVLQKWFQPAKLADPQNRLPYLVIGQLALASHDRELAAENFREGLKRHPGDAELLLGMAEAGAELPPEQRDPENGVAGYEDLALKANPALVAALLFKGKNLSDGKRFADAEKVLEKVFAVNPQHAEAWAAMSGIAFVQDRAGEAAQRMLRAQADWFENPRVPEIIGTCLARHYRFEEGIRFLEEARGKDPASTSIAFELGSNLLRFGRIDEGWMLIGEVHRSDPYHVAAFNLITLRDRLKGFPILERDGVQVRLSPEDAAVFGQRALDLAVRAKTELCEKFGVTLSQSVMVEMLPRQEDFAIRTFGLPGGEAFLGVCFGPLITMTSPRGRLGRNNWEAILWHEMAHTITLEATRHRIPRWLTEGISVHEERLENPGWGMWMNAEYRERFLAGDVPKLADLDAAFGGNDVMLAYFQSSLVVEYLYQEHGMEKIRAVLAAISTGKSVADSFSEHMMPLAQLEESFGSFVTAKAEAYGKSLDWKRLEDEEFRAYRTDSAGWVEKNPTRHAAVMLLAAKLSGEGNWQEARKHLEKIISLEPENHEGTNPYAMLATACRNLGDVEGETAALRKLLELDANAAEAASRLVELAGPVGPEERLERAHALLAINPFSEGAYRLIAATVPGGESRKALGSLIALEPLDIGRLHYDLAVELAESDPAAARRHVLKALEDNPRFRSALEFLVSIPERP
jgi:tetratricopeptide (TPR) repeat protein